MPPAVLHSTCRPLSFQRPSTSCSCPVVSFGAHAPATVSRPQYSRARFGFTASELDRLKRTLLRSLERAIAEQARQPSAALAAELVRHFTVQEPIPGIEYEFGLHQRFLPEITLEEINTLAKDWVPDRNRVVMISAHRRRA